MQATIHTPRLHGGLCDCLARHVRFTKQACLANFSRRARRRWDPARERRTPGAVLVAERQLRAVPEVPAEHLQNTDDLVALKCVPLTGTTTRKTTTWNDHHRKPCSSSILANGYVNRNQHLDTFKEIHGYSGRLPALVLNHFDIQSTARKSHCVDTI